MFNLNEQKTRLICDSASQAYLFSLSLSLSLFPRLPNGFSHSRSPDLVSGARTASLHLCDVTQQYSRQRDLRSRYQSERSPFDL